MHWLAWDILKLPKYEGGFGFRDLYAFNIAMLAKEGWRLIQNPDSVSGQILKARYFPNVNILQAKATSEISYTWHSILKGLELVKKGMIWCIGKGRSVHIWNDPWVPRGSSHQPCSHRGQNLIQWVSDLIEPATRKWDEGLVRKTFHPDGIQTILAILVNDDMEDFISWHFDTKGMFSVRSSYKVQIGEHTTGQESTGYSFPWHKIWKMACPNKVKIFAWRLAHNSLPLKRNIELKGIELDTRCRMCWRLDEDTSHLLFKCKFSKGVWRELQLESIRLEMAALTSPKEVFYYIWRCEEETQVKLITTLWVLNTERNTVNAGEKQKLTGQVGMQIQRFCLQFLEFFTKKTFCSTIFPAEVD
jgi:hypothetical protein